MLFKPQQTEAAVLVSEATTRLPTWAMHGYAQAVLDHLKPSQ
jgi:hypothetical protein